MLRFQGEEYRAPSSLHTHRKVAQKDPIFPPKATLISPSTPLHDVNVTSIYHQPKNSPSQSFYILANLHFYLYLWKGEEQMWFSPSILVVSRSKIHIYSCS